MFVNFVLDGLLFLWHKVNMHEKLFRFHDSRDSHIRVISKQIFFSETHFVTQVDLRYLLVKQWTKTC